MNSAGWHEQKRTGFYRMPEVTIKELTFPADDEISLVAGVWFLRVVANRSVQLDYE